MNLDMEVLDSMCVGGLISAGICCLFGGPVFERYRGSRLIKTAGPPIGSPFFFQPSLIQQQVSTASVHWLGAKYLHPTLSAACWVFQRAVMIDPVL